MKVKIDNPTSWEGKRREAGSVLEVPVEVYELNSSWMKPTDDEVKDAPGVPAVKKPDAPSA